MTYDPSYSPFPESELKALAFWHDQAAAVWKVDSKMHDSHLRCAAACRNALAAHDALRERFLEQSMKVRALQSTQPSEAA
jgi:hypothetical protein